MARSKYYTGYAYEWTELLYAITENPDGITITTPTPDLANRIRQEWYGFKKALDFEANQRKDTVGTDHKDNMRTLFALATQIVSKQPDKTSILFIKKAHTEEAQVLRGVLDNTPYTNPDEILPPEPEDDKRRQKDDEYADKISQVFGFGNADTPEDSDNKTED